MSEDRWTLDLSEMLAKTQFPGTANEELGQSREDEWASSHLPLVNKGRERKKKANRQLYRHFLSAGQGVYPTTTS